MCKFFCYFFNKLPGLVAWYRAIIFSFHFCQIYLRFLIVFCCPLFVHLFLNICITALACNAENFSVLFFLFLCLSFSPRGFRTDLVKVFCLCSLSFCCNLVWNQMCSVLDIICGNNCKQRFLRSESSHVKVITKMVKISEWENVESSSSTTKISYLLWHQIWHVNDLP